MAAPLGGPLDGPVGTGIGAGGGGAEGRGGAGREGEGGGAPSAPADGVRSGGGSGRLGAGPGGGGRGRGRAGGRRHMRFASVDLSRAADGPGFQTTPCRLQGAHDHALAHDLSHGLVLSPAAAPGSAASLVSDGPGSEAGSSWGDGDQWEAHMALHGGLASPLPFKAGNEWAMEVRAHMQCDETASGNYELWDEELSAPAGAGGEEGAPAAGDAEGAAAGAGAAAAAAAGAGKEGAVGGASAGVAGSTGGAEGGGGDERVGLQNMLLLDVYPALSPLVLGARKAPPRPPPPDADADAGEGAGIEAEVTGGEGDGEAQREGEEERGDVQVEGAVEAGGMDGEAGAGGILEQVSIAELESSSAQESQGCGQGISGEAAPVLAGAVMDQEARGSLKEVAIYQPVLV
ncbi:unnamed protein product [Closterium sp. Yama58-4]|nr:unnamed protein product [Closterium sp. Yama58-4]